MQSEGAFIGQFQKTLFFPLHSKNRQSKSSKQNEHINQVSLNWNGKSFEPLKLPDILIKPLLRLIYQN